MRQRLEWLNSSAYGTLLNTRLWTRLICTGNLAILLLQAPAQRLTWLGSLGGHDSRNRVSEGYAVSDDGSVVVGMGWESSNRWEHPFIWTRAHGIRDIITPPFFRGEALGVSADGEVVVGWINDPSWDTHAFLHTATGGITLLGSLGGRDSAAFAVSDSGMTVVGEADTVNATHAFRWMGVVGMQDLHQFGPTPNFVRSSAKGVAAAGRRVVGEAHLPSWQRRAFLWNEIAGMQNMGTLPGYAESWANDISADGGTVVGAVYDIGRAIANLPDYMAAFRWTPRTGMQRISPPNFAAESLATSADGSVIVGWAYVRATGEVFGFRWTEENGFENLNVVFRNQVNNSRLETAWDISSDGRFIVGSGFHADLNRGEAFLLETRCEIPGDFDCNCVVNDDDLMKVLYNFGRRLKIFALSTGDSLYDTTLVSVINERGYDIFLGPTLQEFTGNIPQGTQVVYIPAQPNLSGDMPVSGQSALVSWLNAEGGRGIATTEWVIRMQRNGAFNTLSTIFPAATTSGFYRCEACECGTTYIRSVPDPTGVLGAGVPPVFTFRNCGETHIVAKPGAAAYYINNSWYGDSDGVVGWTWGRGSRAIAFSVGADPWYSLQDENFVRLLCNALNWASQGKGRCAQEGDANFDGIVDDMDLLIVLANFGTGQ